MPNDIAKSLQALIDRIPEIKKPNHPWNGVPKKLVEVSKSDLRQQILYNALESSSWHAAKQKIEHFIEELKSLSLQDIVTFNLERHITDCRQAIDQYISKILEHFRMLEETIDKLLCLDPKSTKNLESVIELLKQAIDEAKGIDEGSSYLTELSFASSKLIPNDEKTSGLQYAIELINNKIREKQRNKEENKMVVSLIETADNGIREFKTNLATKIVNLQGVLSANWNNYSICQFYNGADKKKGVLQTIDGFFNLVCNKVKYAIQLNSIAQDESTVSEKNAISTLKSIQQQEKKVGEIENRFYLELIFWVCLCLMMGGFGCLAYYAYELHIKPLHLGIALGLFVVSIVGLYVRNLYQCFQIRKILPNKSFEDMRVYETSELTPQNTTILGNEQFQNSRVF